MMLLVGGCESGSRMIDTFCSLAPGPALYYTEDREEEKRWKDRYNIAWIECGNA